MPYGFGVSENGLLATCSGERVGSPFHWKWTEHLMAALQQADSFVPCVLLMDEVEKAF
jgi:hypothetical protein